MRKAIMLVAALMLPLVCLALDANQMHYVEIMPPQAATLVKSDTTLLAPVSVTDGLSSTGGVTDVSAYEGYALIVMGQGGIQTATHTSLVQILYGYSAPPTTALITATQAATVAKFTSYEFDFDTLRGTNTSLYLHAIFTNYSGSSTGVIGSAALVYDAARSSDQTITSDIIDISAYKGNATVLFALGGALNETATYTNTVTFQHGTNSAFAGTYATVTNLAGTVGTGSLTGTVGEVDEFAIDLGRLNKYVRAVSVQQHDVGSVGVILVAPQKSE